MCLHDFPMYYPRLQVSPDASVRVIRNLREMTETARGWLVEGSVGCVIIMSQGPLHAGHLDLVRAARSHNEICVVCLLQNDGRLLTQRNSTNASYDLEENLQLLKQAGPDVIFLPHKRDLSPVGFSSYVLPGIPGLEQQPGMRREQVRDLATLLLKLCNVLHPDKLYFSQKDSQHIAVMKQLIHDFYLDMQIMVLPTVREEDGLAIAHRNAFLSEAERVAACRLYSALLLGKVLIEQGERCSHVIGEAMRAHLALNSLIVLQSLNICHAETLVPLSEIAPNTLLEMRIQVGSVLLADNIIWSQEGQWLL